MLDAQSQATLDIRVQRGIDMVNECWGTEIGPDDEDFQTAAKDAISDILTACFGPAGKIVPASDGNGYTKVTNADAYADASALADAGAESYYGDGEDYVEVPTSPFQVVAEIDVVVVRDPDWSNEIEVFGEAANRVDIDLGHSDLSVRSEWLPWVASRQSDSERVATKDAQRLIAMTVRNVAEKWGHTEPYWVGDILER